MPAVAGQAVDGAVHEDHPVGLVGGAVERDARRLADGAGTAVGADDVPAPQPPPVVQSHRALLLVLGDLDGSDAEVDAYAEALDGFVEEGGGGVLREQEHVAVGGAGAFRGGGVHVPCLGEGAQVQAHRRVRAARAECRVGQAEVVQDLQGARLDALGARALEAPPGALHESNGDPPSGQIEREGEPYGAGADDDDGGGGGVGRISGVEVGAGRSGRTSGVSHFSGTSDVDRVPSTSRVRRIGRRVLRFRHVQHPSPSPGCAVRHAHPHRVFRLQRIRNTRWGNRPGCSRPQPWGRTTARPLMRPSCSRS